MAEKNDPKLVAHARRELEIAGLFNKESVHEGKIGRSTLALSKLFDKVTEGDPAMMEQVYLSFNQIVTGELLSPPTTNPAEWEPIEGANAWRNVRCPFYMSSDKGVSWTHIGTKAEGKSKKYEEEKSDEHVTKRSDRYKSENKSGKGVRTDEPVHSKKDADVPADVSPETKSESKPDQPEAGKDQK